MIIVKTYKNPYRMEYLETFEKRKKYDNHIVNMIYRNKRAEYNNHLISFINYDISSCNIDEVLFEKDKFYGEYFEQEVLRILEHYKTYAETYIRLRDKECRTQKEQQIFNTMIDTFDLRVEVTKLDYLKRRIQNLKNPSKDEIL